MLDTTRNVNRVQRTKSFRSAIKRFTQLRDCRCKRTKRTTQRKLQSRQTSMTPTMTATMTKMTTTTMTAVIGVKYFTRLRRMEISPTETKPCVAHADKVGEIHLHSNLFCHAYWFQPTLQLSIWIILTDAFMITNLTIMRQRRRWEYKQRLGRRWTK